MKAFILFFVLFPTLVQAHSWIKSSENLAGDVLFLEAQSARVFAQTPSSLEYYPHELDWSSYATKVKHQGHCNSCVAFSSVATLETLINIQKGRPDPELDLSEQYLWSCGQKNPDCKKPWNPSMAAFALNTRGVSSEACLPYGAKEGDNIACASACPEALTELIKIQSSKNISGSFVLKLEEVVAALQTGPLVGKMMVYEDFMRYAGGIYHHEEGKLLGGHSVSIMGYNLEEGYFIAKNSWGEAWGEKGFFRIKFEDDSGLGAGSYQLFLNKSE